VSSTTGSSGIDQAMAILHHREAIEYKNELFFFSICTTGTIGMAVHNNNV
jgi:hypothetical protein